MKYLNPTTLLLFLLTFTAWNITAGWPSGYDLLNVYTDVGRGYCKGHGDHGPQYTKQVKHKTKSGVNAEECLARCNADSECTGYRPQSNDVCTNYYAGDLTAYNDWESGGGEIYGRVSTSAGSGDGTCFRREVRKYDFTNNYRAVGSGFCTNNGQQVAAKKTSNHNLISIEQCKARCDSDPHCTGYNPNHYGRFCRAFYLDYPTVDYSWGGGYISNYGLINGGDGREGGTCYRRTLANERDCICPNGTPVPLDDERCLQTGDTVCQSCSGLYFLNDEGRCDIKVCECTYGEAVPANSGQCPTHGQEMCQSCVDGFALQSDNTCAKLICEDEGVVAITDSCFCAGHETPCMENQWCYDAVCTDSAKYGACTENAYSTQPETCICGSETTACAAGKYCSGGVCSDAPTCTQRDDVEKDVFYGAHLEGQWNSNDREMTLRLPIDADITVNSITWNKATDQAALRYLPANVQPWTVDTSNACENVYELTVSQASFFGDGSHFILNGTHMKTTLRVEASEHITQTIGDHQYTYDRTIANTVPLLVQLTKRMLVRATFKVTVPPEEKKIITLDVLASTLSEAQQATLLSECTATYGAGGKIECKRIIVNNDGKVQIELDTTSTGTKADLQKLLDDLEEAGRFVTDSYDFAVVVEIAHEEFVFVTGAEDNYEDTGIKTVTLTMEVHSRTCVDHTLSDGGVRVAAASAQYIDETVAQTTFVWKTNDAGEIEQRLEFDLCVETVTWTFAPSGYVAGKYPIDVEFTHAGENMGTFSTEAEINLVQADVIADIGFTHTVATYTGPECTEAQKADSFHIGDPFYAKISLGDLVVDAETITCNAVTLTQTRGSSHKEINLKEEQFNFYQSDTSGNSIVCGAELNAALHASVEGYHTDVDFEILVDYKLGTGGDSSQVNLPSERRVLRARFSADLAPARDYRDPAEEDVVIDLELLPAEEMAVSEIFTSTSNRLVGILFVTGIVFGYLGYEVVFKSKQSDYAPLSEI